MHDFLIVPQCTHKSCEAMCSIYVVVSKLYVEVSHNYVPRFSVTERHVYTTDLQMVSLTTELDGSGIRKRRSPPRKSVMTVLKCYNGRRGERNRRFSSPSIDFVLTFNFNFQFQFLILFSVVLLFYVNCSDLQGRLQAQIDDTNKFQMSHKCFHVAVTIIIMLCIANHGCRKAI